MEAITIVDYDPKWADRFRELSATIGRALAGIPFLIEHVGSTAVPGLPAKPIIDIDVVVPHDQLSAAVRSLESIGYTHRGNLGIEGREAFAPPANIDIKHHLYACAEDSLPLRNHIAFRDWLRTHPDDSKCYRDLKRKLAEQFPHDIDCYVAGKTAFITDILQRAGIEQSDLTVIQQENNPSQA